MRQRVRPFAGFRHILLSLAFGLGVVGCSNGAPEVGYVAQALDGPIEPTELLRRLSLDLRGHPPSDSEYDEVVASGAVPESLIDEMLQSEEFLEQAEQWHAEILWPNLSRYRITPTALNATRPVDVESWEDIGRVHNGVDIGADPALVNDAEARELFVLSFEQQETGITLRGGQHAQPTHYCDMRPEAEYPPESVVGTPANRYTVSAEQSATGEAYEATYYQEGAEYYGMVMPIQDWEHCQNYCRLVSCGDSPPGHLDNDGDFNHDCYRDMDAPGVDEGGRHRFDVPGMRCAEGYERQINSCDYGVEFADANRGTKPQRAGRVRNAYNGMRDGWRWQTHYWSRGVPIRTCVTEAQQREYGVVRTLEDGSPIHCGDVRRNLGWKVDDPSCGCGPEGVYCAPSQSEYGTEDETRTEGRLRSAFEREPLRIIRSVIDRDEDYFDVFTTRRSFVNGPLALAWDQQSRVLRGEGEISATAPDQSDPLWPTVDYEDETWQEYERDARSSGILTTLEFLLRFPTARARVSQFRRAFACSSEFDYAPQPDPEDHNPDIAQRSGCSSCHARLEGDGMWFGRYPDRNGVYLDPESYPIVHEACRYCVVGDGEGRRSNLHRACVDGGSNPFVPGGVVVGNDLYETCNTYYATWSEFDDVQAASAGSLWAAAYRDESMMARIDEGPRGMVEAELSAGDAMQRCAAETTFTRFMTRPPSEEEIVQLVDTFEAEGRSYRALVRAVLQTAAYQEVAALESDEAMNAEEGSP